MNTSTPITYANPAAAAFHAAAIRGAWKAQAQRNAPEEETMNETIYTYAKDGQEFRITIDDEGTPWVAIETTTRGRTSCVGMPLTFADLHALEDALTALSLAANN